MRFLLAVISGKLIHFFGKFIKRATNLPGLVALKICPYFFKKLKFKGKIIAVTGSNGKTTTSNMIAHILRSAGYSVANNSEGSNISSGIATTMLTCCGLGGHIKTDFLVLEVDERYTPLIFKDVKLDYFVITNLFRDQVARNGNPDIVYEKISAAVNPKVTLVLNGNDPIITRLSPNNKRVFYGAEKTALSYEASPFLTQDCKVCPLCMHTLSYEYYHYNHIGRYHCLHCGYETPKLDYAADNIDFTTGEFTINGERAGVSYKPLFHFINTTAAVGVCTEAGVPLKDAVAYAKTFHVSAERYNEMVCCGRKCVLLLTKQNASSLDMSISYLLEQPEEKKTALLYVNNVLYTGYRDISWLYDVTFSRLLNQVDHVICSGNRVYDVGVRLMLDGFEKDSLLLVDDLTKIKDAVAETEGTIYILAASSFGDEDGILEALK